MPLPETLKGDHPEPSKRNYLLQTDGSGTGTIDNPAEGAIGVVLRDPDGHRIGEISEPIGPAINTVAEYWALIEGLKLARSRGIQRIRVFLDSELVVDQVNGRAKVGKEHLRPPHTEAYSLLQQLPNHRISWVPRNGMSKRTHLQPKHFVVASAAVHTGTGEFRRAPETPAPRKPPRHASLDYRTGRLTTSAPLCERSDAGQAAGRAVQGARCVLLSWPAA